MEHNKIEEYFNTIKASPLCIAAFTGNLELMIKLLKAGENINVVDIFGRTPLFHAFSSKNLKCCSLLIRCGSKIDKVDKLNKTCLFYAVKCQYIDNIIFLLDNGANIEHENCYNETPLVYGSRLCCYDSVRILLIKGANINHVDKYQNNSLIYAAEKDCNNENELISLLISYNINVNIINNKGDTPLIVASVYNKLKVVELLLLCGCNPSYVSISGHTFLDYFGYKNRKYFERVIEKNC
jgi:ankyrin repeat protein